MLGHWFFDFMLKCKRLLHYEKSFSRNGYGKNAKIILNLFLYSITQRLRWIKIRSIISGEYRKLKNSKISYISEKISVLFIICNKCRNEDEKTFKEEESAEILKIFGLIENK